MNKGIPNFLTSQALNEQIILDYIGFLRDRLYESDLQVIKFFLTKHQINKNLQYSLDYISLATGIPIITVRRAIKRLASFGIIQSWHGLTSNIYLLNEFFKQSSVLSRIKRFLIGFMFIGMLSSFRGGDQHLILKDKNLLKQQAAASTITDELSCWQVMELNLKYNGSRFSNGGSWQYQEKEKVTASKTNEHLKGDVGMFNFTEQQLEQIAAYSQEAVARAGKRLKQVTSEGRAPQDPFSWFLAICRSYVPTEEKPSSPFTPGFKKEQQPQKQSQPPKEWSNQDDIIRQRLLERKQRIIAKAKECGVYDPRYTLDELRMQINGYKVLPLSENVETTARTEMSQPEPVTKSHDIDWNSLIPPLIFDENFDSQYQEILD